MRNARSKTARLQVGLVVISIAISACSGSSGSSGASVPPAAGTSGLEGVTIVVGSKDFNEQFLLAQIAIQALTNAGAEVEDRTGIGGTAATRAALTSGEIDMYWEYTGTGWVVHLRHEAADAPADPDDLAAQVKAEDIENDVVWLEPARANNGYAIAASADRADELGIDTLSDYAELVSSDPAGGLLCAAPEFVARDDGWAGVEDAYGFDLPDADIVELAPDLVYDRLSDTDSCSFGEVFGTDSRILANDLVIIEDDLGVFVAYNMALTIRSEVYAEYGRALEEIFDPITALLSDEMMIELNARVDVDGQAPAEVAAAFLEDSARLD